MNSSVNKSKIKYVVLLLAILIITVVLFIIFGAFYPLNVTESENKVFVETPKFSRESGFYDEAFDLRLSIPEGTKVYYTLDCSNPNEHSTEYKEPIHLDNATKNENVYSMRTDVSAGFYSDLIEKYITESYLGYFDEDPNYKAPDYLVDKCNVVRAIAIDIAGNTSEIITKTYFVDYSSYDSMKLNTISITTDPENLFGYEKGIYVTGKSFDDYFAIGDINNYYWHWWDANYRKEGKAWEREVNVDVFDSNGILTFSKKCGLRTQGNASKGAVPRGLKLYARKKYGGKSIFDTDLFNTGFSPECVILTAGSDVAITQFNDYMMSVKTDSLNFATMDFVPYVLFLDGEYWGFYWMTEKYDEAYLNFHYGVDENNVLIIKEGRVTTGNEQFKKLYSNMKNSIISNDMSVEENYKSACKLIDINSYIDYYATQIYIGRSKDFPVNNFALWRTVEVRNDEYSDGKWRWMMFDSNSTSMQRELTKENTLEYIIENDEMFASLWKNESFRNQFEKRILEIADKCFDAKEMDEFIDSYSKNMLPIMRDSWKRFYGSKNDKINEYNDKISGYKEFFDGRKAIVESWFEEK